MRPTPQTAPQLAEGAAKFVEQKFGFSLPYNPGSLVVVDALIDKIKETGASPEQASGILFGLGCYVGEVFVRNAKASWRLTPDMRMSKVCRFPIVVALPGAVGCDPIGKVFGRYSTGESESVAVFYESTITPDTKPNVKPDTKPDGKPETKPD